MTDRSVPRGFYLMHRGWMRNDAFGREPFNRRLAWVWLIEQAAFAPHEAERKGAVISLGRGEIACSLRYMAKAWGWAEPKVRRYLARLKRHGMIETATKDGLTVVRVVNYDLYQTHANPTQQPTHQPTHPGEKTDAPNAPADNGFSPDPTQLDLKTDAATDAPTDAKDKEGIYKEGNNNKADVHSLAEQQFETFWQTMPSRGRHPNPKKAAKAKFLAAVKNGVPAGEIIAGAQAYADYCQAENTDPQYIAQAVTWINQERWTQAHGDAQTGPRIVEDPPEVIALRAERLRKALEQ